MKNANTMTNKTIHKAVASKDHDLLKKAIAAGMPVDDVDSGGRTPLHMACQNADHEAADLLLKAGADVMRKSSFGMTAIQYAVGAGDIPVTRTVVSALQKLGEDGSSAIINALDSLIFKADDESVLSMIRHLVDFGALVKPAHLTVAAGSSHALPEVIALLAKHCNINAINTYGETPVIAAVRSSNVSNLKTLIGLGAKTAVASRDGESLVSVAITSRKDSNFDALHELVKAGGVMTQADFDAVLRRAIRSGNTDLISALATSFASTNGVSAESVMINALDAIPFLSDDEAALDMVAFLIKSGAKVKSKHLSAAAGKPVPMTGMLALLAKNCNAATLDGLGAEFDGTTLRPICAAAKSGHPGNIGKLIQLGANPYGAIIGEDPLMVMAIKNGNYEVANGLMTMHPEMLRIMNSYQDSFIHTAAQQRCLGKIAKSVEIVGNSPNRGILNHKNMFGYTAAEMALIGGAQPDAHVAELLNYGASISQPVFSKIYTRLIKEEVDRTLKSRAAEIKPKAAYEYEDTYFVADEEVSSRSGNVDVGLLAKLKDAGLVLAPKNVSEKDALCEFFVERGIRGDCDGLQWLTELGLTGHLKGMKDRFGGIAGNAITQVCLRYQRRDIDKDRAHKMIGELLAMGINPNRKTSKKVTPAMLCLITGDIDLAKKLMKKGGKLSSGLDSDASALTYLITNFGRPIRPRANSKKANRDAVENVAIKCLEFAEANGVNLIDGQIIDQSSNQGPLVCFAAYKSADEVIKFLLDRGADINSTVEPIGMSLTKIATLFGGLKSINVVRVEKARKKLSGSKKKTAAKRLKKAA